MSAPLGLRLSWTPYRIGVVAMVVVTVGLRWYAASRSTWLDDDWNFMHDAARMDFFAYVFHGYKGHVLPGGFLLSWVLETVAPLRFGAAILVIVLMSVVALLVWAIALREVFGERSRMLIPLALIAFTPLAVRPTIWWTSAVLMLPLQFFTGLAVLYAARYARRPDLRSLVGVLLALVGGLFFWEKALLMAIPVAGTLLFCSGLTVRQTFRRSWPLALVCALGSAAFLVYYKVATAAAGNEDVVGLNTGFWPGLGPALGFYTDALTHTLMPAALGGPWGTTPVVRDHLVEIWRGAQAACGVVVLVLTGAAVYWRRRAWLPLTMVAAYVLVACSLVLFSNRYAALGVLIIRDERYTIDCIAVGALGLAMLLAPARGTEPASAWRRPRPARLRTPPLLRVTSVLLGVSLLVGNGWVVQRWGDHPARAWVQNLLTDVHEGPKPLYDDNAPAKLPGFPVGEEGRLSFLLAPVDEDFAFDQPADTLYVPDTSGHLRPAQIGSAIHAEPGPRKGCGYLMSPGSSLAVPMSGTLFDYHWGMQLTAYAGVGGVLEVDVGDHRIQFPVLKGFARHQAGVFGPVEDVTLRLLPGSQPVCVTDLIFGPVGPGTKARN